MELIHWKRWPTALALRDTPAALRRFRRRMEGLADRFFAEPWPKMPADEEGFPFAPSIDVSETDKEIAVRAEVPGIDPRDVEVSVRGNILSVTGSKKASKEEDREDFYHCERQFGSFRRSMELPACADADAITASLQNGVLTVRVPKRPEAALRHVEVKSGARPKTRAPAMAAAPRR